jgi:hypothetical protein
LRKQGLRELKCTSCGPPGKSLHVTLTPNHEEARQFKASIVVRGDFGDRLDEVRIPVSGRFVTPVRVSPSLAQFGEIDPDVEYQSSVSLEVQWERPIRIMGVVAPDGLTCRVASTKNATATQIDINGMGRDLINASGKTVAVTVRMDDSGKDYVVSIPVFAWHRDAQ